MAIQHSNGLMTVTSIPTHTPVGNEGRIAVLKNSLKSWYYSDTATAWIEVPLDLVNLLVQSVSGTNVNNADPRNPIINLQTAAQTTVADAGDNYTGTQVEAILAEIAVRLSGIVHTAITDVDLVATANPNEYTVQITWTDGEGNTQTTTDATPITITGLATALQTVADTNSINLTKTGTEIKADLKISATQVGATVSIGADGLNIEVHQETKPPGYLSKAAATTALGAGKKFRYLAANVAGAVEDTIAWT